MVATALDGLPEDLGQLHAQRRGHGRKRRGTARPARAVRGHPAHQPHIPVRRGPARSHHHLPPGHLRDLRHRAGGCRPGPPDLSSTRSATTSASTTTGSANSAGKARTRPPQHPHLPRIGCALGIVRYPARLRWHGKGSRPAESQGALERETHVLACVELPVASHFNAGEMDKAATWHLRSVDHAPAFVSVEPRLSQPEAARKAVSSRADYPTSHLAEINRTFTLLPRVSCGLRNLMIIR